jgi:hypothetical protein
MCQESPCVHAGEYVNFAQQQQQQIDRLLSQIQQIEQQDRTPERDRILELLYNSLENAKRCN